MTADGIFESVRDFLDTPALSPPGDRNTIEPHFHTQIEVLYNLEGENIVTINDTTVTLKKDQLAIADTFDIHSLQSLPGNLSISFIIPQSILADYNSVKNGRTLNSNFILDTEVCLKFKNILELLRQNWSKKVTYITQSLMNVFLAMIVEEIGFAEKTSKTASTLSSNVLHYISDNFSANLSLKSVAALFGYSDYYFSRLFSKTFKVTFNNYLNMTRVKNSLHLIKDKGYTVLNASEASGFGSLATFYRFINQYYKISPKKLANLVTKSTT